MLRATPAVETGLDIARELIGLTILAAICGFVYHLLAGLAAHIQPVLP